MKKHRDINLVTTERRRNYLLSELNFHTTKFFTEVFHLLAVEVENNADSYEEIYLCSTFNTRSK